MHEVKKHISLRVSSQRRDGSNDFNALAAAGPRRADGGASN
jgi:hypothetical protein